MVEIGSWNSKIYFLFGNKACKFQLLSPIGKRDKCFKSMVSLDECERWQKWIEFGGVDPS